MLLAEHFLPLLITLVFCSGCALDNSSPDQKAPISALPYRETSHAANMVARQDSGRISGPGEGGSMSPLYGRNSYLVIQEIEFDDLQAGMIVAYTNLSGRRVVHALVAKEGNYWTVQGINNTNEDSDFVTPKNLLGVVYGAFQANL